MKCLIISDTHGDESIIESVTSRHQDIDVVIHCGDSELSKHSSVLKNMYTVQGNCDKHEEFPEEVLFTAGGIHMYVTHGHLYNVKMTYVPISYRAEELNVKFVCFGHSHVTTAFEENGIIYVNPGSLRLPRNRLEKTYIVADFHSEGNVTIQFFNGETGEEIQELSRTFLLSSQR